MAAHDRLESAEGSKVFQEEALLSSHCWSAAFASSQDRAVSAALTEAFGRRGLPVVPGFSRFTPLQRKGEHQQETGREVRGSSHGAPPSWLNPGEDCGARKTGLFCHLEMAACK